MRLRFDVVALEVMIAIPISKRQLNVTAKIFIHRFDPDLASR
jgi:hypothetical protein